MKETLGYCHPDYARSLAEYGTPRKLPSADGWIIERPVPGRDCHDAMGPYPLFSCQNWQALPADLEILRRDGLVSLTLVTEPLPSEHEKTVIKSFDHARPFKTHYLAELDRHPEDIASSHHRYYARKAAKVMQVEIAQNPLDYLDEWSSLYKQLVQRHSIRDLRTFSRESFACLLGMPGVYLFRALYQGRLVGAQIVLLQGDAAYAHLSAFTDEGYRHGASYLLDWHTLEHMQGLVKYINWGGGLGSDDGLTRYKLGWSTSQTTSWLLGSILDQDTYRELCAAKGLDQAASYFPCYRLGEFAQAR